MDKKIIMSFFENKNSQLLYNEASVQFELGWYLREKFPDSKIQLERNVNYIFNDYVGLVKREIDILISKLPNSNHIVIEIKASIGQGHVRPVTVFEWIKDIRFLEQLSKKGIPGFSIFITDNFGFQEAKRETKDLLKNFRSKNIEGSYIKHERTANKNESITLEGKYLIEWEKLNNDLYYFIVEIPATTESDDCKV